MSISSQSLASPDPKTAAGSLGTLVVASLTVVTVFKVVDWSAAQTALVTAEAGAVTGLIIALVAHLTPGRPKEPVALAATLTAAVSATLALGAGFGWWSLSEEQTSALVSVVTAVLGVGGALIARRHVTPQSSSSSN
jgi:hypothetical protein